LSNIVSTTKFNAIFLAAVLVVGTFAAISPSFIIGINAQSESESYNYEMEDDRYNDYKQDYGMYNSYDKRPYGNSYDQDYKSDYSSYGEYKDKSKDGDFIKKIKCDNNNLNINGDNTADFNIGNHGQAVPPVNAATKEGGLSSNSFGVYDSERNNNNAFKNNGKFDPDCGINNKNNNNVQLSGTGTGGIGPQGPAGQQGPPGLPGTPGPNQILPANLYYNPGDVVSITGTVQGTPGNSTATCQAGDIAIGGNFDVISYTIGLLGDPTANIAILYDGNEGFDKYSTDVMLFSNPGTSQLTFTTNVLCLNNP
jgi:hypothetical protein